MQIQQINETQIWTDFLIKLNKNTFLHSHEWLEFNQPKNKVWQLGLFGDDGELISICLVVLVVAKRGRFMLVPHGPQYFENLENETEILSLWRDYLIKMSKKEHCSFFRIQPIVLDTEKNRQLFTDLGFRWAPIHMHTELTTLLDISEGKDKVLMNMRKTTRQMVKKGEKMIENKEANLEFPDKIDLEMHEVYQQTYIRGGAVAYSAGYIDREWEIFQKNGNAKLIRIKYEGKTISWGMILICGKRAFYHQGGNILHKNVPGSYLVQWNGIKFAMEKGCESYDFWGVSPLDKPNHPWANISLFKRGFGGNDVQLLHAQDYVLSWKYWFNWFIEKRRAKSRGFD